MKRNLIIVYSVVLLILIVNFFYYRHLYTNQINYFFEMLARQVQVVGLEVDKTNNEFISDLNQINFSEDLKTFFIKPDNNRRAIDKMKLFYLKYEEFITAIKYFDIKKNEFTLKRDPESESGEWLEQSFILHLQPDIYDKENLIHEGEKLNYYLPVYDNNLTIGNIVVTVDFQKYFKEIFTTYNLPDYQWQWVVSDSGNVIYDNYGTSVSYSELERIAGRIAEGSVENTVHEAILNGKNTKIISSYYSTQLLQSDLGLVFSAPTAHFQKYIIRNSLIIVFITLILITIIIYIFLKHNKIIELKKADKDGSNMALKKMFDDLPVGVILHDNTKQIVMANKTAMSYYSAGDQSDLALKFFGTSSFKDSVNATANDHEKITVLMPDGGEKIMIKETRPVLFHDTEKTLVVVTDVTLLENARKLEVKKNDAKTDLLARMSYEIRTPLNGIVSMAEMLGRQDLTDEAANLVRLLRKSSEVLLHIVDNILEFSRIESGNLILDEVPFKIREVIDYCIDIAKTRVNDSVEITSCVDADIPDVVIGDPLRIREVLTNLLNHSISNTGSGQINVNCLLNHRNEMSFSMCFEVEDTGRSFDEETIRNKFQKNSDIRAIQLDDSSFGTIVARELVQFMKGEFHAVSPSGLPGGTGLKVCFAVDMISATRMVKKLHTERHTSFTSINALVIAGQTRDDEAIEILHQLGLSVAVTTFTKLTVNQVKANINDKTGKYDLIIIPDGNGFNGFDVAQALWDNKLSEHVIIIIISSEDKKGNLIKAINLGVDHYITRPIDSTLVSRTIRESFPFAGELIPVEHDIVKDLRILFVEDNKMNQLAIGTILKNMGYTYDLSEDGYSAFLQAKSKKYDLILMDIFLPEINGFESARKILKEDPTPVIVALTADSMPETRKKAELAGIKDFLTKPVKPDDLKKTLARHFK